jgi:molybdate transport system permease protein
MNAPLPRPTPGRRRFSLFWIGFGGLLGVYLAFWAAMLGATATFTSPGEIFGALASREIRHATVLSFVTCTVSALASTLLAVPVGYLMARRRFPGHALADAALDIPIVLPPMVVGICLLIFFQTAAGRWIEGVVPLTYAVGGVIVAQFVIAAAFAVRTMRNVFDHLSPRPEEVARTLGASRWQAFRHVAFPAARPGMVAAASVAWARSLGEFGPVLVFAGATRMKTEVLPTSVWLAWSVGDLEEGVAVSLLMILLSSGVLMAVRATGERV